MGTYGRAYGLSVSRRARGRSTCQHLHGSDGLRPSAFRRAHAASTPSIGRSSHHDEGCSEEVARPVVPGCARSPLPGLDSRSSAGGRARNHLHLSAVHRRRRRHRGRVRRKQHPLYVRRRGGGPQDRSGRRQSRIGRDPRWRQQSGVRRRDRVGQERGKALGRRPGRRGQLSDLEDRHGHRPCDAAVQLHRSEWTL